MSQAFAEYLRNEEIDWDKLDDDSRVALRRQFTRIGDFEESKIVESERQSVDLKQIVARHIRNDLPYKASPWWPDGGDASLAPSLESALEVVRCSTEAFDALPADIRFRFGNDPVAFLEFVGDGSNKDEAIRLGLLPKPEEVLPPEPISVRVVPEPSA